MGTVDGLGDRMVLNHRKDYTMVFIDLCDIIRSICLISGGWRMADNACRMSDGGCRMSVSVTDPRLIVLHVEL